MRSRGARSVAWAIVLGSALAGAAQAGETASPARAAVPAGALDLSLRGQALGIFSEPLPAPAPSLGLEPGHAPTGAGSLRMPSETTEVARGVYLTVSPSCLPGVDEPPFPLRRRPPAVRR